MDEEKLTRKSDDCSCEHCQSACTVKPGWFLPGQAEKVARYLGKSLKELFDESLSVDWWVGADPLYLITPAVVGREGGMMPGSGRGTCVFFKDGKCSIHAVKPFECRMMKHDDTREQVQRRHRMVAHAWEGRKHQRQIRELYGDEPQTEDYSIFDMLMDWR